MQAVLTLFRRRVGVTGLLCLHVNKPTFQPKRIGAPLYTAFIFNLHRPVEKDVKLQITHPSI